MSVGLVRRSIRVRTPPVTLFHPPSSFYRGNHANNIKRKNNTNTTSTKAQRPCTSANLSLTPTTTNPGPTETLRNPLPTPRLTTININDLSSEAVTVESITRRSLAADYMEDLMKNTDILAVQETGLRKGNNIISKPASPALKSCITIPVSWAQLVLLSSSPLSTPQRIEWWRNPLAD